jgi:hypothetical protein
MPVFVYEVLIDGEWEQLEMTLQTRRMFIQFLLQEWIRGNLSLTGLGGFLSGAGEDVDSLPEAHMLRLAATVMTTIKEGVEAETRFLDAIVNTVRILSAEPSPYDDQEAAAEEEDPFPVE